MREYQYLIIGGGMTADAAVQGIREIDPQGTIGLISAEPDAPYDRPPLTKSLWKGEPEDKIWRHTDQHGADLHLGRLATSIDISRKNIRDDRNEVYAYRKLLLATGGTPRRLPFGGDQVIYFRTVADYRRLRALSDRARRVAVIGGGFIGSELAASLASNGKEVVMIFPGPGVCSRMFPADLSQFLNEYYQQKGVEVLSGQSVTGLEQQGRQWTVQMKSQPPITVDGVVAGLGIELNLDLARQAGLQLDHGIQVDECLRTSHPDIYAAGDVASFYNPALGKRIRVEHEDNANTMGKMAGRNMAGRDEPYHHLPFFYSDLFDLGYEAVGELDAGLQAFADWKEPYREGVVYYQREGRVRGVLLWNVWEQVEAARELIAENRPFRPEELKQKLPKAA